MYNAQNIFVRVYTEEGFKLNACIDARLKRPSICFINTFFINNMSLQWRTHEPCVPTSKQNFNNKKGVSEF